MVVLIYPNQLFDPKFFPDQWKKEKIFLIEEPIYWGTDSDLKLKMNKLKLVLHRASMKYYFDLLKKKDYNVTYIEEKKVSKKYSFLSNAKKNDILACFDPTDHEVRDKIEDVAKKYDLELQIEESPNFLHTTELLSKYVKDNEKSQRKDKDKDERITYFHAPFYTWSKKQLELNKVIGSKTYDTENRKSLPSDEDQLEIPKLPKGDKDTKWVKEAIKYVNKTASKNYGKAEEFYLPVTHNSSEKWFKKFLKERFSNFGDYQDAITSNNRFIFHSVISPMLNVGLLNPKWVVSETVDYYKSNKSQIGKNDFEGFLRQIIGWREYSRMLYLFAYDEVKGNYFEHDRKLTSKWYTGDLDIIPIDWTIKTAFKVGYLHHILRLMVMANFMNLVGLHPDEIFTWFMEFSLDSYQWVMHNNIYGMGTYADGGLTMRKPYLSSSNYILKMSNFKKDGKWDTIWTDLFYRFLVVHEEKLNGTPYVRNLYHYKKKTKSEQKKLLKRANDFIHNVTKK